MVIRTCLVTTVLHLGPDHMHNILIRAHHPSSLSIRYHHDIVVYVVAGPGHLTSGDRHLPTSALLPRPRGSTQLDSGFDICSIVSSPLLHTFLFLYKLQTSLVGYPVCNLPASSTVTSPRGFRRVQLGPPSGG